MKLLLALALTCAPVAALAQTVNADTPGKLASGVQYVQPKDWNASRQGAVLIFTSPEGDLRIAVADIGAGSGFLARYIAPKVGPTGRVIATELDAGMVAYMNDRARREGLANVSAVQGRTDESGLEPSSIDRAAIGAAVDLSPNDDYLPPAVAGYAGQHPYPLDGPDRDKARELLGDEKPAVVFYAPEFEAMLATSSSAWRYPCSPSEQSRYRSPSSTATIEVSTST